MRRLLALALLVASSGAIAACGDDTESAAPSKGDTARSLAGAPAPIASLHRQSNDLLPGGAEAFEARLRSLRGHPVVVNKWASWCDPCRAEFPFFQKLATERGKEIAFIGVNSTDNDGAARNFLERFPVPYPSYKDPDLKVAAVFNGTGAFPATAFYDREGKMRFLKQGGYATAEQLLEDIETYALG